MLYEKAWEAEQCPHLDLHCCALTSVTIRLKCAEVAAEKLRSEEEAVCS